MRFHIWFLLVTMGLGTFPVAGEAPQRMYWTTEISKSIMRANLDGSDVEVILDWGLFEATLYGIAIDTVERKMYWADETLDAIRRANLDGSEVETLVQVGPGEGSSSAVVGIALDLPRGKVYWTDWRAGKIQRSNLDGSDFEDIITTGLSSPQGIIVDTSEAMIYWVDYDQGVRRANLDGSNPQALVGENRAQGIALDLDSTKMCWTKSALIVAPWTGKIRRANRDGSQIEDVYPNGLQHPRHIEIIPDAVDLCEYAVFFDCVTGPGSPFEGDECAAADFDDDGDVDIDDVEAFFDVFTGPGGSVPDCEP